jgi:leucyl-tRNA synthetase
MRDLGMIGMDEPFTNLLTQGMVLNEIFYRKSANGRVTYYNPADVEVRTDEAGKRVGAVLKADGQPVESDGIGTMSKSKNNGVDPQALIEKYGADTARFFIIFTSPPEQSLEWSDAGVEGSHRFLRRLWAFCHANRDAIARSVPGVTKGGRPPVGWERGHPELAAARREVHTVLGQVNYDVKRFQFNTVASGAMKILNALSGSTAAHDDPAALAAWQWVLAEGTGILLRVLAPITPHVAHALWRELGYGEDILHAPWPDPDPGALEQDEITLVVQVNGKLRGEIRVPKAADKARIEQLALGSDAVRRHTDGQKVKKVIVVPGRLVNVVV